MRQEIHRPVPKVYMWKQLQSNRCLTYKRYSPPFVTDHFEDPWLTSKSLHRAQDAQGKPTLESSRASADLALAIVGGPMSSGGGILVYQSGAPKTQGRNKHMSETKLSTSKAGQMSDAHCL
ncbi:uncharacterized protein CLUP02_01638 [Colletotrichum lupini]|uniref:Uncharacterized protein n=1 Tax=Colletotrichum lupini TaxID=145971 RepID=A0A9Q8SD26_9PEZI|nr:uncharacterized protein CLUP02_01638 [Colletotrichum lupini]UQC74985.1 hypothetical protein CLUP02_01638 [Colletotrichum lupini]